MDAQDYIETVVRPVLRPWWNTLRGEARVYVLVDDVSPPPPIARGDGGGAG
jgi:hypothetical protein